MKEKRLMRPCLVLILCALTGCSTVDSGHVGLMFKSFGGGLQRDKLTSGMYWTGPFNHIVDFDVTYSTHAETIETTSAEGLPLSLKLSVIYRPVVGELYELDSDIGQNYYDEVIAPEFKSAARGVFAHHSYQELLRKNEAIEDEVETDLRRRTAGKHVEISSVTLEGIVYAQTISKVTEDRIAGEQDALRQKTLAENEDARRRMQIKNQDEQDKIAGEATLRHKRQETELAKQQAEVERIQEESEAAKRLIKAHAEAEETKLAASAKAEETKLMATAKAVQAKAANQALTPLAVMMHGYDALKELGGKGTNIYLGDWSKMPNFLFPPAFQGLASSRRAEPAQTP